MASSTSTRAVPQFEIWQAEGRILSIDDPVRIRLLRLLEQKPRTLNQLVAELDKAKSTLSGVHLPPLVEAKIVQEQTDPKDARVKWFKVAGHRLGSSDVDRARLRDAVLGYVQSSGLIPLRPLLEVLDLEGLSRHAHAEYRRDVAKRLGRLVSRMLMARERSGRVQELSELLEREGLGHVEWRGRRAIAKAKSLQLQPVFEDVVEAALDGGD